jgi:hypothetical protein
VASARRAARLLLEDNLLARREMATGSVR